MPASTFSPPRTARSITTSFTATNRFRALVIVVAMCAAGVVSACTESSRVADGPLAVRDAWARAADSGTTGGVYMTVTNKDTVALSLTGVSSAVATSAEVHESMQHDGMVHMMPRTELPIPRDSSVAMAPGGIHIMLNNLTRALRAGDTIQLQLTLSDGRTVSAPVVVRAP